MKKVLRISAILALAAFAACNTITQPQQSTPGGFNVDFPASDGSVFPFDATNAAAYSDGSNYTVVATANSANITLSGIPISSSVPYTVTSTQNSTLKVQYHDPSNNLDYSSSVNGGSCSISISQTSPTLMGTFVTARLINSSAHDTITVTSATFNAVLK